MTSDPFGGFDHGGPPVPNRRWWFLNTGRIEYIVRAIKGPVRPSPTNGMNMTNSASDGMVRKTGDGEHDGFNPRHLRCDQIPRPTAMIVAKASTR